MKIKGKLVRSLTPVAEELAIDIIDQTALPHAYRLLRLRSLDAAAHAIRVMQVRGAPLIGVTAAYGLAMALHQDACDDTLNEAVTLLGATRPTAVNLHWALAPIYAAADAGLDVHVWVSETRPRNQGLLTAWELKQLGIAHTLIADNAAALLLLNGQVDAVIVGADRIAANGDVANKVGTCLKALAAREAGVPFLVAAPRSTIDFACPDGAGIPIEERHGDELRVVHGLDTLGASAALRQFPVDEAVGNPAFDVTPARLVCHIITERGVCPASAEGLRCLYPE